VPISDLPDPHDADDPAARRRNGWLAVGLGLAVDIGGTVLSGIVLGLLYGAELAGSGLSGKALEDAAAAGARDASWISIGGLITGTLCSVAGGWVCARVARSNVAWLTTVLGLLSVGLGLLTTDDSHAMDEEAVLALVTFCAVKAGGWLATRRRPA